MIINVFYENIGISGIDITEKVVLDTGRHAAEEMGVHDGQISVILCDDVYIRDINCRYRNKDRATDVISFVYDEIPFPEVESVKELGDIYISCDRAKIQASEAGISFQEEMQRLLIHGILHVLGYDHETNDKDARIMFTLEEKILQGVKAVE